MRLPSTEDMLDAWERGAAKGPVERGVILARLADVEATEEALTALPVGERDRHLLALRAAVFGPRLTGLLACEACGEQLELDLAVDDLCRIAPSAAGELVVADGDYVVWLRLPDSRDLRDAAAAPPDDAARVLLHRCVVRAALDGVAISIDALPAELIAAMGERLSEADPLADLRFALTCVQCAHACQVRFDTVAFLWTELDAWAGRIQHDVHVLASAYGWAERDILRLGPARRARYLRMVEG
jgi:hypothetical protein